MATSYAFVTLVTSDAYLPGALTLAAALKDVHPSPVLLPEVDFETVCLVTPENVDVSSIKILRRAFNVVVGVETIVQQDDSGLRLLGRPDLNTVLTKLHVFRLIQYSKIVFLDADVLPIRPLSHLFTLPHEFAAVPDVGWPDIFNSGVLLLTPGEAKFTELNELLKTKGSWDGGDQGLLNEWRGDDWHRLSFTYNTTPTAAYTSFTTGITVCPRMLPNRTSTSSNPTSWGMPSYDPGMDTHSTFATDWSDDFSNAPAAGPIVAFQSTIPTGRVIQKVISNRYGARRSWLAGTPNSGLRGPHDQARPAEGQTEEHWGEQPWDHYSRPVPEDYYLSESQGGEDDGHVHRASHRTHELRANDSQTHLRRHEHPVYEHRERRSSQHGHHPIQHSPIILLSITLLSIIRPTSFPSTPFSSPPAPFSPTCIMSNQLNITEWNAPASVPTYASLESGCRASAEGPAKADAFPSDTYFPNIWDQGPGKQNDQVHHTAMSMPDRGGFFQPLPPAEIPDTLWKQGHYRQVTGESEEGAPPPQPDVNKVKQVFPWEEKPRHLPGRVFPVSEPPLLFVPPISLILNLLRLWNPFDDVGTPPKAGTTGRRSREVKLTTRMKVTMKTARNDCCYIIKGKRKEYRVRGVQTVPKETRSQAVQVSIPTDPPRILTPSPTERTERRPSRSSAGMGKRQWTPATSTSTLPPLAVHDVGTGMELPLGSPTVFQTGSPPRLMRLLLSRLPKVHKQGPSIEPAGQGGCVEVEPTRGAEIKPASPISRRQSSSSTTSTPSSAGPVSPPDTQQSSLPPTSILSPSTSTSTLRKTSRVWDPARGVELFKRSSEEVLARFLKMGSWEDEAARRSPTDV
ncbi:glycosyltransferase family protein [Salix suchowensis]|nr:glycosyltransferase family protein [Salix suchowensis]